MSMKRISRAFLGAILVLGCDAPIPDADREVARRDSAGVMIVEIPGSIWADAPRWTTSTQPSVEIGAVEGSPEYLFSRIRGVVELSDGRFVVADGGSSSLRWYDQSGHFLYQRGGSGEGPGEFGWLGTLMRIGGDTLVITDSRLRRITEFGPEGELARIVQIEGITVPGTAHRLPDGGFVVGSGGFSSTQLTGEEDGLYRTSEPLVRIGGGLESPDTVGMFPGPEIYFTERSFGYHPFSRGFDYAVRGELLFVAAAEGFVVDAYSADGQLVRSIRAPDVDLKLTPEMIETYELSVRQAATEMDEDRAEATLQSLKDMYYPETRPAYSRLLVSDEALWLEEHQTGLPEGQKRWAIFGHDGEYRGTAVLPSSFRLQDVRGDHLLGSWTDELGVEYARIYRLLPAER
jgi:hypothetical protein